MTVIEAQKKITDILKQLEMDSGELVETIGIYDIDITNMGDEREQLQRRVEINMRRNPGHRWNV